MAGQADRFGPTRRGGPVFRWLGEALALDLANTVMVVAENRVVDLWESPEDVRRWLDAERARLDDVAPALSHIEEVRALRDAVRSLLEAAAEAKPFPADALDQLNGASAAAPVAPTLVVDATGELHVRETPNGRDSIADLVGKLARSAIELLATERDRLRICRAPSCGMFFVGERIWCCAACGNRARVARHYRRRRAAEA